jgi:hypothetical protein
MEVQGEQTSSRQASEKIKKTKGNPKMIVSVLEEGFLWRVRVLQGQDCSTSRNKIFTSALSVVQVRLAGPGCLTDGCPNVHPTNKDRY